MSYPKRLLRLQPTRGLILDTADQETGPDYWTKARNVQFRDGFAQRLLGNREVYIDEIASYAPSEFMHALNTASPSTNFWLTMQSNGQVHAIQPGTATRIDNNLVGASSFPWQYSSALINGVPILNNAQLEPVYWPFSGNVEVLPDWTATETAGFVAVLRFHVFAMNISGPGGTFPNLVKWSSATEPGTVPASWTPAPDNDAGSTELADTPGSILCAVPLGESLIIYKRAAAYQVRFVGGNNVFSFRRIQASIGALTPRSAVDIGGAHFLVTDGDVVLFDGTNKRSVGESIMRDYLFDNLDSVNFLNLFCVYNAPRDEVLIAFPSIGQEFCDQALVYDVSRDSFGIRDLETVRHAYVGFINDTIPGNTWADRTETWQNAVGTWASVVGATAKDSLVLVKEDVLTQEDIESSIPIDACIGKTGLTFGEPERVKFIKKAFVRTKEPYGEFFVRVGSQMTANGPVTWASEVSITGTEEEVPIFAQGKYISVEVRSADANIWTLTGIELEAELRGYY